MVEFVSMSKLEAEEYFQRFMAEMPACERRLADTASATGGPSPESLDHAPESLVRLWDWAATRLAWREGYEPPALGLPGPRIDAEDLEPADQLPSWFHHPSGVGYARFSQPVVAGLGDEIMPIQVCAVLASKALTGGQRSLREAFDNWISRRADG